jgi:hypothetical protein
MNLGLLFQKKSYVVYRLKLYLIEVKKFKNLVHAQH